MKNRRASPAFGVVLGVGMVLVVMLVWRLTLQARQEKLDAKLIAAIQYGELDAAVNLLKEGAHANAREPRDEEVSSWRRLLETFHLQQAQPVTLGPPALFLALRPMADATKEHRLQEKNLRLIRTLLEKGADVNFVGEAGNTPLIQAARTGNLALPLLLEHGADVNHKNRYGATPLSLAASVGDGRSISALLDHGALVDALEDGGTTPLMIATTEGHLGVIGTLLAHGADPDRQDNDGDSARSIAATSTLPEVTSLFRKAQPRKGKQP